jgi:AbrB family looped-hinge helix DNA binding protein
MFHDKPKMWGVTTIGEKGQVVIPCKLREELGIDKGDQFVVVTKDSFVGLIREKDMTSMLHDWIDKIEDSKNSDEDCS